MTRHRLVLGLALLLAAGSAASVLVWRGRVAPRSDPLIVVATRRGSSPVEMDAEVAAPLSRALGGVAAIERAESVSAAGVVAVRARVRGSADRASARAAVEAAVKAGHASLPPDVAWGLAPESSGAVAFALPLSPEGGEREGSELRARLLRVPGVVDVSLCGGAAPHARVRADESRLLARKVKVPELAGALGGERRGGLAALGELPLPGGALVKDVATVERAGAPPACRATLDGAPAAVGLARVAPSADPARVRAALSEVLATPPSPKAARVEPDAIAVLRLELPVGPDLGRMLARLDADVRAVSSVQGVVVQAGAEGRDVRGPNEVEIRAIPRPPAAAEAVAVAVAQALASAPGLGAVVWGTSAKPIREVTIACDGDPFEPSRAWAAEVARSPGVRAARVAESARVPRLAPTLDREKAAALGVSAEAAATLLRAATDGAAVGTVTDGAEELPVILRIGGRDRTRDPSAALQVSVLGPHQAPILLASLFRVELTTEPVLVLRVGSRRAARVEVSADDASALRAVPAPAGCELLP